MAVLYRQLNVRGNLDLIDLDALNYTKYTKRSTTVLEFHNGEKKTCNFFAPKTLKNRYGILSTVNKFVGTDETPPMSEQSFKALTKIKCELPTDIELETSPLMEISSSTGDIDVKTEEASQFNDQ